MAQDKEAQAESIVVLSDDPVKNKKKDAEGLDDKKDDGVPKDPNTGKKVDDLSDEDLQLKNELEMLVERLEVSAVNANVSRFSTNMCHLIFTGVRQVIIPTRSRVTSIID